MSNWARRMGESRRRSDEAASQRNQAVIDRGNARSAASLLRWRGIVGAIRAVVAGYNEGAGREALAVAETAPHADLPSVTIESGDAATRCLAITLDDAEILIRSSGGDHPSEMGERRIDLSRSDDDTAKYVLQSWLERLGSSA